MLHFEIEFILKLLHHTKCEVPSFQITKPSDYTLCSLIKNPHLRDLAAPFCNVVLIDTNLVGPDNPGSIRLPNFAQGSTERRKCIERMPINFNLEYLGRIAGTV